MSDSPIMVRLPSKAIKIIETKLVGLMGKTKSEVAKNIIIAYLSEKSYIKTEATAEKK